MSIELCCHLQIETIVSDHFRRKSTEKLYLSTLKKLYFKLIKTKILLYLADIELLRELIENRSVTVAVFVDDRDNERHQLVPEVQRV